MKPKKEKNRGFGWGGLSFVLTATLCVGTGFAQSSVPDKNADAQESVAAEIVGDENSKVNYVSLADEGLAKISKLNQSLKQVVKNCTPATVALVSASGTTGSGVIVSKDGLILTAAHVIQGEEEMMVVFPDGSVEKSKVLGAHYTRDAAMVKLQGNRDYPYVALGNSDTLNVGDYVVALGHAKGFDPNRRAPIRFGRLVADGKQRFMMSECTLIGGDSGGPLFNLKGELIGIHSSIGPHVMINNHVPLHAFRKDWDNLVAGKHWGELGMHPMADPDMPILGFAMGEAQNIEGVVVMGVLRGSPADKIGLKRGDLVTELAGRKIRNAQELIRELERHKAGNTVDLSVVRHNQEYKAAITLERRGGIQE